MRPGRFLWNLNLSRVERIAKSASPQAKIPKLRQAGALPKKRRLIEG